MRAKSFSQWFAVIVVGIATIYVYHPRVERHSLPASGFESVALAHSIAERGEFSNPFSALNTGPSAHLAPLYPAYLALFMRIFRTDSAVASALVWASLLQLALQLMLFPVLTKRLGLGFGTGIMAGSAWILSGIPPIYRGESTLAAVLIICAAFLMERSLRTEISRSQLLLWGMVWGILLLLQPVVTVVLLAWTFVLHFRSQHSRLQKLALATLPLVMVTPWLIRNFVVFHRPVFIRDNLGLELAVSNNSCAQSLFDANDRLAVNVYEALHGLRCGYRPLLMA